MLSFAKLLGTWCVLQPSSKSSPDSRNGTRKPLRTEPSSPETAHGLLLSLCGLGPALGMGSCLETGTHTACLTDAGPAGLGSLYLPGELAGHAHRHPSPRAKPGPRHKASLPGDQPHNSVTLRKLSLSLQTSLSLFQRLNLTQLNS